MMGLLHDLATLLPALRTTLWLTLLSFVVDGRS